MKKILGASVLMLALAFPVLAETSLNVDVNAGGSATTSASIATKITCVGTAVATREATLGAAVGVHAQAVQAAYTTRAIELAGAYSNTTAKTVKVGVKTAWSDFTKSVKTAQRAWASSRTSAWAAFRTAAAACKPPAEVSDSVNASAEVSGQ